MLIQSSEVKARYNKKTYKAYGVNFRIVEDSEAIEAEKLKDIQHRIT